MSGGAGHVMDMNNRMRQNRSMKTSNKQKFKSNSQELNFKFGNVEIIEFKKVSEEALEKIKNEIRLKGKKERKKDRLVFFIFAFVLFLLILVLIYN